MEFRIPLDIERALELTWITIEEGCREYHSVYAYISSAQHYGERREFALLAQFPVNGLAYLGEINPKTLKFELFDKRYIPTYYERAKNNVICKMLVPISQLVRVKSLDEILAINKEINIEETMIPVN